jgi:hypothetical protein
MTLDELIERLTDLRDSEGIPGHTEVRVAQQPSYPLLGDLDAVTTVVESEPGDSEATEATVYLASGNASDYGSRSLWDDDIQYQDEDEDEDYL